MADSRIQPPSFTPTPRRLSVAEAGPWGQDWEAPTDEGEQSSSGMSGPSLWPNCNILLAVNGRKKSIKREEDHHKRKSGGQSHRR